MDAPDESKLIRIEDEKRLLNKRLEELEDERLSLGSCATSVVSNEPASDTSSAASLKISFRERMNLRVNDARDTPKPTKRIGSGTFGEVFLSTFRGERCALKVAKLERGHANREEQFVRRFIEERPRGIVPFFECYTENENLYIRMLYVSQTLRSTLIYLDRNKQHMKRAVHLIVFSQLAIGMRELHERQIVHRDLKPENILINPSSLDTYICDFGCSKIIESDPQWRTSSTTYMVSRHYRAPELIIDRDLYGAEIDVWSFGCMLVEASISDTIFAKDTNINVLIQQIRVLGNITPNDIRGMPRTTEDTEEFPSFKTRKPKLHGMLASRSFGPSFVDLCEKILQFDPRRRPTAAQIAESRYLQATVEKLDTHTPSSLRKRYVEK